MSGPLHGGIDYSAALALVGVAAERLPSRLAELTAPALEDLCAAILEDPTAAAASRDLTVADTVAVAAGLLLRALALRLAAGEGAGS